MNDHILQSIFNLSQALGGSVYGFQLMTRFAVCANLLVYFQNKSSNLDTTITDVYTILHNVRVDDNIFTFEEIRQKIIENEPTF